MTWASRAVLKREQDAAANLAKLTVNFLRDRDGYQIPVALSNAGHLECLVTDFYATKHPNLMGCLSHRVRQHSSPLLAPEQVLEAFQAVAIQLIGIVTRYKHYDYFHHADIALAKRTLRAWRKRPTSLLLYSGYAYEVFRAAAGTPARKLLFVYHPSHQLIRRVLSEDVDRFPEASAAFSADKEVIFGPRTERADREFELADGVVVASAFTAKSVREAGFSKEIEIVPYYAAPPIIDRNQAKVRGVCNFLFVGQGIQRKGLHHLFRAWRLYKPSNSTLTCVCATMAPGFVDLVPPDVRILGRVDQTELNIEYGRAHVFVLPSLVEGFGLVYNEARSHGNFLIYSVNSGAPDMSIDDRSGVAVIPGDVDALGYAMNMAATLSMRGGIDHEYISSQAHYGSWAEYVDKLSGACSRIMYPSSKRLNV